MKNRILASIKRTLMGVLLFLVSYSIVTSVSKLVTGRGREYDDDVDDEGSWEDPVIDE